MHIAARRRGYLIKNFKFACRLDRRVRRTGAVEVGALRQMKHVGRLAAVLLPAFGHADQHLHRVRALAMRRAVIDPAIHSSVFHQWPLCLACNPSLENPEM
jgi:hypothetical protein